MKKASLFILCLTALGFSSCCCQNASAPKLRPMPKDTVDPTLVIQEPIPVVPTKK